MKITWLGHSGFRIEIEQAVLLVDPWLTGNPLFPAERRDEALQGATHLLLTHGHGDHSGDTVQIAKKLGIPVVGIYDLVTWWQEKEGIDGIGFNKGGTVTLGGAKVTMVAATHSSSVSGEAGPIYTGTESGYMISGEGHTIYVSGDTDIMADMGWMGECHKPDIGILAAGGHFTMDMKRAAFAARKYFDFRKVIPCHYRTFPLLEQDASSLREGLPGVEVIEPEVLEPIVV
ncbi:metal-dependent hydrolase [Cereibacter sphaeroides]|uniref:metal-dependent hydrolase n=1 Tax=Cereibacter sphaeroides TaxID=1063 RepID=UPI001F268A3A|nr:metal-dependent hydrolase [Cereibacter sphaeroides]MCE6961358.1 metal-dependent hydrolase [Cereibacter sphaeroides]MCE6970344.1 metal-dependent hydrolase [Cereibacter sphaeroides]MCE6973961.1 metal-dependent hydrolase [Cereibacter sphaeroides]